MYYKIKSSAVPPMMTRFLVELSEVVCQSYSYPHRYAHHCYSPVYLILVVANTRTHNTLQQQQQQEQQQQQQQQQLSQSPIDTPQKRAKHIMAASTAVNRQRQGDPSPQTQRTSAAASSAVPVCPPSQQAESQLVRGLLRANWRDKRSLRLIQSSEMTMSPRCRAALSAAAAASHSKTSSSAHRFQQTRKRRESLARRRVISAAAHRSTLAMDEQLATAQPIPQPGSAEACPPSSGSSATTTACTTTAAAWIVQPDSADTVCPNVCPENYLVELLRKRGRVVTKVSSTEAGYHQPPTVKQVHDYDSQPFMSDLVRRGDLGGLQQAVEAGRGMDASNKFGESVVHVACRRGKLDVLRFLLANGGSLTACDDLGRFPLHEVCWAVQPRFDIVRLFLDDGGRKGISTGAGSSSSSSSGSGSTLKQSATDAINLLLVTDKRGCTPLRYVKKDSWPQWCRFLDEVADHYWPSVVN